MPKIAAEVDTKENNEEPSPVAPEMKFPEESKRSLRGLLYLGELTDEFTYAGHEFAIKTLTEGELLKAAQLVAKYEGTVGHGIAHRCAIVSASLVRVDGEELYQPLSETEDEALKRFDVVLEWYPVVIDQIFNKCLALDQTAAALGERLGKA